LTLGTTAAFADPAELVSFSWSINGAATASASATCIPSQCELNVVCSPAPVDSFQVGGATIDTTYTDTPTAGRSCSAACLCCLSGAAGSASARVLAIGISASTSETLTQWTFGAWLQSSAGAMSPEPGDGCAVGSGSGGGVVEQQWTLVFDTEGASLSLARNHIVNVIGVGSLSESEIALVGPSDTIFVQSLSRSDEGVDDGSGTTELNLPPGQYTYTVQSRTTTDAVAPPNGGGGGAQADARSSLTFMPLPTSVESDRARDILFLAPVAPNPFSVEATIRYSLPEAAYVRLTVHDVTGARVASLVEERQSAGPRTATWEGRGQSGARVPPGVYFARLEAAGDVRTRRMTLLR
jgi:hypothetical protein